MTGTCTVCNEGISKYKCSKCFCPYCSLDCWKKHKSGDACIAKEIVEQIEPVSSKKYFTEDTVSCDKLSQLGESELLKNILKNKYLQNMLIAVDNASNPDEAVQRAMKNPEFVEFVDECLKIVENVEN